MKKSVFFLVLLFCPRLLTGMCNGRSEFCDKKYNEIFGRVRVHNTASYYDSRTWHGMWQTSLFHLFANPVADQRISFEEQLFDSPVPLIYPRVFKLPLHPVEQGEKRVAWISHTLSEREFNQYYDQYASFLSFFPALKDAISTFIKKYILWRIDATNMPLAFLLLQLKTFLENNPNEVVTLSLNVFDLTLDELLDPFRRTGICSYIHVQSMQEAWPTLKELIAAGKRLIIFQDQFHITSDPSQDPTVAALTVAEPWIAGFHWSDDFVWGNKWGYTNAEDLKNDFCDILNLNDTYIINQAAYQNKDKPPYNKIFDLSHTVTPGMTGDIDVACDVNRYEVLMTHIKKCHDSLGVFPNTVTLDFYDVNRNDLNALQEVLAQSSRDAFGEELPSFYVNGTRVPADFPGTCPADSVTASGKEEL